MTDIIRVIRVLEYVGPRENVEKVMRQNAVKRARYFGGATIREAILGEFPEIVQPNGDPL